MNRTYRDNEMFRERYNSRQQALFYVLAAYSVYNTEVGYCQGMSQIAALLLMYFQEEEEAFWALSQLMAHKKYAMHGKDDWFHLKKTLAVNYSTRSKIIQDILKQRAIPLEECYPSMNK